MPNKSVCERKWVRSRNSICACVWHFTFQCISRLLLWKLIRCFFKPIASPVWLYKWNSHTKWKKCNEKWMKSTLLYTPQSLWIFSWHFSSSGTTFWWCGNSLLSRAHSYLPKVVNYKLMWLNQKWRKFVSMCSFERNGMLPSYQRNLHTFQSVLISKEWESWHTLMLHRWQ